MLYKRYQYKFHVILLKIIVHLKHEFYFIRIVFLLLIFINNFSSSDESSYCKPTILLSNSEIILSCVSESNLDLFKLYVFLKLFYQNNCIIFYFFLI